MYDGIATLYSIKQGVADRYGNVIDTYESRDVFVMPRGVYQSEYYNAAQLGIHPSITFTIANRADYNDEKILKYEGKEYRVVRVDWNAQRDSVSLVCEERIGESLPIEESES